MKLTKEQCAEYRKIVEDYRIEMHGDSALNADETISLLDTIAARDELIGRLVAEYKHLADEFCYQVCDEKPDAPLEEHTPPCQNARGLLAEAKELLK